MEINPEFKDTIKKYLTFSLREYKAALALLLITLTVWYFSDIQHYFFPKQFDNSSLYQKAVELDALQKSKEETDIKKGSDSEEKEVYTKNKDAPHEYFEFNPNTASQEELIKLGLSKKQINIIKNYIAKAGEIKSKTDFKKIYGITEMQFEALDKYLLLPETVPYIKTEAKETKTGTTTRLSIELNSADSNTLDQLPGIGMGYARRIIKYRTALGGFLDLSQLLEVYGFRQTLLDSISPYLTLDVSKIKLLNLNTSMLDELKSHPYIRYKIANAIVSYRQQHGNYKSLEELKNIVLITEEVFSKIKSYLSVD